MHFVTVIGSKTNQVELLILALIPWSFTRSLNCWVVFIGVRVLNLGGKISFLKSPKFIRISLKRLSHNRNDENDAKFFSKIRREFDCTSDDVKILLYFIQILRDNFELYVIF
jgi:hypothetical protein